jgi:hypothetical protein
MLNYGTADLMKAFQNADEFDKPEVKKQIAVKQNEIKSKIFVMPLCKYQAVKTDVNGNQSSSMFVLLSSLNIDAALNTNDLAARSFSLLRQLQLFVTFNRDAAMPPLCRCAIQQFTE